MARSTDRVLILLLILSFDFAIDFGWMARLGFDFAQRKGWYFVGIVAGLGSRWWMFGGGVVERMVDVR